MEKVRDKVPTHTLAKSKNNALNKPLKVKKLKLCFKNLHIKYNYFCQHCKDYFKTIRAKTNKHALFATLFSQDRIDFCWQQYKIQVKRNQAIFFSQDKFNHFEKKSLRKSILVVKNIWSKIKQNFEY